MAETESINETIPESVDSSREMRVDFSGSNPNVIQRGIGRSRKQKDIENIELARR